MKKLVFILIAGLISSAQAWDLHNPLTGAPVMTTLAIPYSVICNARNEQTEECYLANVSSTIEVLVSLTLLKEMYEVRAESLHFAATGNATQTLVSVVEKFQQEASIQGLTLGFDTAIDTILSIE